MKKTLIFALILLGFSVVAVSTKGESVKTPEVTPVPVVAAEVVQPKEVSPITETTEVTGMILSETDMKLIAAVVHGEAGNQPFEGKVAVAKVILNRYNDYRFPKTIKEIVYAGNGKQFCATRRKDFGVYTEDDYKAVQQSLVTDIIGVDVVYFSNVSIMENIKFKRYLLKHKVIKIGDHTFAN